MQHENTAAGTALERTSGPGNQQIAVFGDMTPEVFEARIKRDEEMRTILRDYVKRNMKLGYHFDDKIGTQELKKPMLLQEGARNICSLFKLVKGTPDISETWLEGDHYRVRAHVKLFNAMGIQIASGDGICSTRETKYAFRKGDRICPECETPAIRKDNKSPQGGFYCWAKLDGCGAKFAANDERITGQQLGRVDNPDKADIENTVLKMAIKRAFVAAVCDVPMVSELFAPERPSDEGKAKPEAKRSSAASGSADKSVAAPAAPAESVVEICDALAGKLLERGTDLTKLTSLLPEGVKVFAEMTEDQAIEVRPKLVELLNAK
jgi:hypothetical protein